MLRLEQHNGLQLSIMQLQHRLCAMPATAQVPVPDDILQPLCLHAAPVPMQLPVRVIAKKKPVPTHTLRKLLGPNPHSPKVEAYAYDCC
jgi:hypothetical protein